MANASLSLSSAIKIVFAILAVRTSRMHQIMQPPQRHPHSIRDILKLINRVGTPKWNDVLRRASKGIGKGTEEQRGSSGKSLAMHPFLILI
jgi:hypothetical protein